MGIVINFEFGELKQATEAWKALPSTIQPALVGAMEQAQGVIHQAVTTYPAQKNDLHLQGSNPAPFYSERQRRWFFAALNSGELELPYQRTGELGASWQKSAIEQTPTTIRSSVFTNLFVAKWVQSSLGQAGMFLAAAPYWQTAQDVVRDRKGEVTYLFSNGVSEWLQTWDWR